MDKKGVKLFMIVGLLALGVFIYLMLLEIHDYNKKIEENPVKTAVIQDIIELKFGDSKYMVVLNTAEGMPPERREAKSESAWDVYAYGETVNISIQDYQTLIFDTKSQLSKIAVIMTSTGFFGVLFMGLFFSKKYTFAPFIAFCFCALIMFGFGTMAALGTHFKYEESKVFIEHSEHVSGTLVDYIKKTCNKGKRNKTKYNCYEMLIEYVPNNSTQVLRMQDETQRYRYKNTPIGTKIEVAYLKSNHNIARLHNNVTQPITLYIGASITILFFSIGFLLLKKGIFLK